MWVNKRTFTAGFSRGDIINFKARWPASGLRDQQYWFQFDQKGDLVDTNVGERDDGSAASALAEDARSALRGTIPEWATLTTANSA